jgi:hypothetical protein
VGVLQIMSPSGRWERHNPVLHHASVVGDCSISHCVVVLHVAHVSEVPFVTGGSVAYMRHCRIVSTSTRVSVYICGVFHWSVVR